MPSDRKPVIVTFKRKDKRKNQKADKRELLATCLEQAIHFYDCGAMHATPLPRGADPDALGFDVDLFEAPILTARLTPKEIARLRKQQDVASVEDDGIAYASGQAGALVFEGVPSVAEQETVPAGLSQIAAPAAWRVARGAGVRVAVLDTGVDGTHPDLAPNFRGGVSFVPDETSTMDFHSHGTHCAGTIAAAQSGAGVVGVAPLAQLFAVKVLSRTGKGAWSSIIAGVDWCIRNGMHIASMSLGGAQAPTALQDICRTAFERGVLLIAAAGNEGGAVGAPARYASVVAVSNIDSANTLWPSSNRGPEIELCAPGVNVLSTLPGGGHGLKTGTSMACPHVSGAAALAWSSHRWAPGNIASNVAIRRLLAVTADNLGAPARDPTFGFGRVNAERAAFEFAPPPAVPGLP